jgi:tRNA pseudouridine55 synthase
MTGAQDGIILCNKPPGITSSDLVVRVRRSLGVKMGHAGTLDKFAEGLLILLSGRASSFSSHFLGMDKCYEAVLQFGRFTDTHDPEGETVEERSEEESRAFIKEHSSEIAGKLREFESQTEQIPPVYSALKIEGRRYSDIARRSAPVVPQPRAVRIYRSELLSIDLDACRITCRFDVASGTYIRSIARDLSYALHFPLHIRRLIRLSTGPFQLSYASPADGPYTIRSVADCLDWPSLTVTDVQIEWVRVGRPFQIASFEEGHPLDEGCDFFLKDANGRILAWAIAEGEAFRYRRVFMRDGLDGI